MWGLEIWGREFWGLEMWVLEMLGLEMWGLEICRCEIWGLEIWGKMCPFPFHSRHGFSHWKTSQLPLFAWSTEINFPTFTLKW